MVAFNTKRTVDTTTENYDLYVRGPQKLETVVLNAATAGYVPAVGDILCRKADDSNKHQKYDPDDVAQLTPLGIVDEIESDNTGTPVQILHVALDCWVRFAALGYTGGTMSAAEKLAILDALRGINVTVVG